ncbi:hypothetical protein HMPREF9707_00952 [Falseniella ignava CCUG 37419]|uniref:DUF2877 domain-containing protein n=2 Tax=Falseniella ignava TaxID=137730 RepID=K1LGL8_9LACT|nr:hypothetical protein HMPREF9707_00952 [Falseniella ignava CCUG 37419]
MLTHSKIEAQILLSQWIHPLTQSGWVGKVGSIFQNGFNLNIQQQLIYVSAMQPDQLSPIGCQVALTHSRSLIDYIKPGMLIKCEPHQWTLYRRPQPIQLIIRETMVESLSIPTLTFKQLAQTEVSSRLNAQIALESTGLPLEQLDGMLDALKSAETQEQRQAAVLPFIGAGIGLTPSGDDFLQGILIFEQALNQPPVFQSAVRVASKERQTTSVSSAYYRAVLAGQASRPWIQLMLAIQKNDTNQLQQAIQHIQHYGHTSGYDMLAGAAFYLTELIAS